MDIDDIPTKTKTQADYSLARIPNAMAIYYAKELSQSDDVATRLMFGIIEESLRDTKWGADNFWDTESMGRDPIDNIRCIQEEIRDAVRQLDRVAGDSTGALPELCRHMMHLLMCNVSTLDDMREDMLKEAR